MQRDNSSSASAVSFCPSFNTYSSDKLADVAAKVSLELAHEEPNSIPEQQQKLNNCDDNDDFEFFSRFESQIHQVFPVFNRDLLKDVDYHYPYNQGEERSRAAEPGWPLKKLFVDDDDDEEEQGAPPSSSSSDADEQEKEEVPELAFCIWSPKRNPEPVESSPSRCKKSNSTGSSAAASSSSPSSSSSSSKKWLKFRDLLKRSNSDGKDSFVFLSKPKEKKGSKEVTKSGKAAVSAHEAFYVKNRAIKEGDKKRSYLPYRQDLLGFFANYNGFGRTLPPF